MGEILDAHVSVAEVWAQMHIGVDAKGNWGNKVYNSLSLCVPLSVRLGFLAGETAASKRRSSCVLELKLV